MCLSCAEYAVFVNVSGETPYICDVYSGSVLLFLGAVCPWSYTDLPIDSVLQEWLAASLISPELSRKLDPSEILSEPHSL